MNHDKNLGPVRTFNLVCQPVGDSYVTLLEDDNWWEPTFLERMLAVMEANPEVHIAGANMHLWRQETDGSWTDTGTTFVVPTGDVMPRYWPDKWQLI